MLEDVYKFLMKVETWFEMDVDDSELVLGGISMSSRENGDVGEEQAGQADIKEATRILSLVYDEFGDDDIVAYVDIIDEWVYLVVEAK